MYGFTSFWIDLSWHHWHLDNFSHNSIIFILGVVGQVYKETSGYIEKRY